MLRRPSAITCPRSAVQFLTPAFAPAFAPAFTPAFTLTLFLKPLFLKRPLSLHTVCVVQSEPFKVPGRLVRDEHEILQLVTQKSEVK